MEERLADGLEEARLARAEEAEGHSRRAQEGAQDPGHLCADQPENDHPAAEDRRHVRSQHPPFEPFERAARLAWLQRVQPVRSDAGSVRRQRRDRKRLALRFGGRLRAYFVEGNAEPVESEEQELQAQETRYAEDQHVEE